ncbi:MAG: hypothetical protein MJE68_13090 [Proteobacteria bacterium]|nr:hypothetical protein [Pseudomonadota bacterium]
MATLPLKIRTHNIQPTLVQFLGERKHVFKGGEGAAKVGGGGLNSLMGYTVDINFGNLRELSPSPYFSAPGILTKKASVFKLKFL